MLGVKRKSQNEDKLAAKKPRAPREEDIDSDLDLSDCEK
jgi:hypothetical protein